MGDFDSSYDTLEEAKNYLSSLNNTDTIDYDIYDRVEGVQVG